MARQVASRAQLIQMNDLLREHLSKPDGSDVWVYEEGWDDQRIAATVGGLVKNDHVARMRVELFGPIRRQTDVDDANLRAQVASLVEQVAAMREMHKKLCLLLSVNRVVDARHLAETDVKNIRGAAAK